MLLKSAISISRRSVPSVIEGAPAREEAGVNFVSIPYGTLDDQGRIIGSPGTGVLHVSENAEHGYHIAGAMRGWISLLDGVPQLNVALHFPLTFSLVKLEAEGDEPADYSLCPDTMLNAGMALYRDYTAGLTNAPNIAIPHGRGAPLNAVESYTILDGNEISAPAPANVSNTEVPPMFFLGVVMNDTNPLRLMRVPNIDHLPTETNWFGMRDDQQAFVVGAIWLNLSESDPTAQLGFRSMIEILHQTYQPSAAELVAALQAQGVEVQVVH